MRWRRSLITCNEVGIIGKWTCPILSNGDTFSEGHIHSGVHVLVGRNKKEQRLRLRNILEGSRFRPSAQLKHLW